MSNFIEIKFNNPGVLGAQLPTDVFNDIKSSIEEQITQPLLNNRKPTPYNKNLVGHLSKEYKFVLPESFLPFLETFILGYCEYFNYPKRTITDQDVWINLQQKTEYNPIHVHNADLSWVLWVKIPYKLSDEDSLENSISSSVSANGRFMFTFTTLNGNIRNHVINIDKTFEGKIVLFPSYLNHSVNPFYTSDEYRISIAGNIHFK